MSEFEINFGEICRTCLKKPTDFRNINEPASNAVTLADMIKYCTSISVDDGDLLPTNLCIECVKDVEIAYKFKTKTEKVNSTLREYLQAQIESFQQTIVKPSNDVQVKREPIEECLENIEPTFLYPEVMMESTPDETETEPELEMPVASVEDSTDGENEMECMAELEKFSNDFIEYKVRLGEDDDDDDDDDVIFHPVEVVPSEVMEKKLKQQKNKKSNKKSLSFYRKKNFPCPVCPKRFRDRKSCVEHYRVHTGERPYECNQCGATFHRNYSYQHHITYSHTQNAPHKCHLCQRSFKTNPYLKKHLKSCNSFGCENCLVVFPSEEALRQHQSFSCETRTVADPLTMGI